MRSLPQKVTGYRYEEETACEQKPRDFKGGYCVPPSCRLFSLAFAVPAPSRSHRRFTLVSQLLFFDASSFLIAANRDVKTIRALLLDSEPDAQFFSRYRRPSLALARCRSAPLAYVSLWRKARCVLGRLLKANKYEHERR